MNYKAVMFDLDGTLLDTLDDLADSLNKVLEDKGFPTHSIEVVRIFIGNGIANLVSRALPEEMRYDRVIKECLEAFRIEYHNNWNKKTKPYYGISELLDALDENKIEMAVVTNKPQHYAELCIREFFPDRNFSLIIGQRDGIPMKPDPTGPHEILRYLNLSPPEVVYLGDSDVDMLTAVNTGLFPVGALWGFRSEKELRESGAASVISKPADLLKIIL